MHPAIVGTVLAAVLMSMGAPSYAADLDSVIRIAMQSNDEAVASQKKIDKLHEQTRDLLTEYRTVRAQIDSIKVYNAQLELLIAAQEDEKVNIQQQIDDATQVAREITPLMLQMMDALDQFVTLDVPFLIEERRERVARLRDIIGRADVTESEKYRQILEAYQIENEYGRTIETYQASLGGGDERTLNFLRIGRVVLVYQTLDGGEAAVWDQNNRVWQDLSSTYRSEITKGLRMARKQAAPDLLRLPVPAPKEVTK